MTTIVAVTSCPTGIAHTLMAGEALKRTATLMGYDIKVELQSSLGTQNTLTADDVARADVVILAADIHPEGTQRFEGKPVYSTSTSAAIRDTRRVIADALAQAGLKVAPSAGSLAQAAPGVSPASAVASGGNGTAPEGRPGPKRLVGITSCPTGIAHTFMAAKALDNAAKALGHTMKVETQGSVGAQNVLTDQEIAEADAVVIAADTGVDQSRFAGKPLYATSTNDAINNGQTVITSALATPPPGGPAGAAGAAGGATAGGSLAERTQQAKSQRRQLGFYKHLMTGVSYMLPFVVAGGIMTALAFAVGGIHATDQHATFPAYLVQIGGVAFSLFVGVLAAFIAYSIADRPGLAPGFIGGVLAQQIGAGFLGGIIAGFIAGYLMRWLNARIQLGPNLNGLKPVLILPVLGALIVGLIMIYVIGGPVAFLLSAVTHWLTTMQAANAYLVGLLLGAMMAFDMGGPINKSAYTFSVGLLASHIYTPMAAVMAAGMTPPLGLALASWIFRNRFDAQDQQAAGAAFVLGLSFITEGAIPYASKDPLRVIPSCMLGAAVAGAISMGGRVGLLVPHGGIFVLAIPDAVTNLGLYFVAIAAGTLVTAGALYVLKRPRPVEAAAPARQAQWQEPAGAVRA